jgi:protoporphyrinogen oxidase
MNMTHSKLRVAIIGGGPGGLLTAYLLQHTHQTPVDITIFEASNRLGGKIITRRFDQANALYEAGAAELYDYSAIGPDPLRELIHKLQLPTHPITGRAVFLNDHLLRTDENLTDFCGPSAMQAYNAFRKRARNLLSPADYYESDWKEDNKDPLNRQTFDELLSTVPDEIVRKYIEVSVHSDVATEPRHTSASYGLQNFLMNEPGYMQLYGIDGGIEQLPRAIADRLHATIRLNSRVSRVQITIDGNYRVFVGNSTEADEFDFLVVALPNYWIPSIDWADPNLAKAMSRHHAHYDYPAHYLRVTVLFSEPFWRKLINESYFMIDAFGGCCLYDESSRGRKNSAQGKTPGVLGWLIGGENALALSNLEDAQLIQRVLDSLPQPLRSGKELAVEGRVQRWVGAVNARPGGFPLRDPDARHLPDPEHNPWLFVVGDYLFDSTLNGVMDSADYVAEWINEEVAEAITAKQSSTAGAR